MAAKADSEYDGFFGTPPSSGTCGCWCVRVPACVRVYVRLYLDGPLLVAGMVLAVVCPHVAVVAESCGVSPSSSAWSTDTLTAPGTVNSDIGDGDKASPSASPVYQRKINEKMSVLTRRVAKGESNVAHLRQQVCVGMYVCVCVRVSGSAQVIHLVSQTGASMGSIRCA